jgi:hypothetical protein
VVASPTKSVPLTPSSFPAPARLTTAGVTLPAPSGPHPRAARGRSTQAGVMMTFRAELAAAFPNTSYASSI